MVAYSTSSSPFCGFRLKMSSISLSIFSVSLVSFATNLRFWCRMKSLILSCLSANHRLDSFLFTCFPISLARTNWAAACVLSASRRRALALTFLLCSSLSLSFLLISQALVFASSSSAASPS